MLERVILGTRSELRVQLLGVNEDGGTLRSKAVDQVVFRLERGPLKELVVFFKVIQWVEIWSLPEVLLEYLLVT